MLASTVEALRSQSQPFADWQAQQSQREQVLPTMEKMPVGSFPQRALFDPMGMASAVLEPDAAGTFTGSSFMYATARDWAKFGLLYLQDGCWERDGWWTRILPEGWARYSAAPSKTADFYGAHFWRGVPNSFAAKPRDDSG